MVFLIDKKSYEPAYVQLKNQIVDKIEHCEFKTNEKLPSVREIEKITGLSRVTVAKAVSELIRENLLVSHGCKGTFVAESQEEIGEKTDVIGITGEFKDRSFFSDPYFNLVMRGMEKILSNYGKSIHFKQRSASISETFANGSVDGIIIFGSQYKFKNEFLDLSRNGIPTVTAGQSFDEEGINYVGTDNIEDSSTAVEGLIKSGHQKIAFITYNTDHVTTRNRLKGYKKALKRNNIKFDEKLIFLADRVVKNMIPELIKAKPTALFFTGVKISIETVGLLLKKGMKIPDDLEVLTYDDFDDALSVFDIPYQVIKQPVEKIGIKAAEALIDIIEGRKKSVQLRLRSELVIKDIGKHQRTA